MAKDTRKLLIESSDFVSKVKLSKSLKESVKLSAGKAGTLIVRNVPCTLLNRKNLNGRIYSTEILEQAISEAQDAINTRQLLCSGAEHPESSFVPPAEASHVVIGAYIKKGINVVVEGTRGKYDVLFMDLMILNTQNGKNVRALFEAECSIGTSIRGLGDVEGDKVTNYTLLGVDLVGQPSSSTYTRMPVSESVKVELADEKALTEGFTVSTSSTNVVRDLETAADVQNRINAAQYGTIVKTSTKVDEELNPKTGATTSITTLETETEDEVASLDQALGMAKRAMLNGVSHIDSITIDNVDEEEKKESVEEETDEEVNEGIVDTIKNNKGKIIGATAGAVVGQPFLGAKVGDWIQNKNSKSETWPKQSVTNGATSTIDDAVEYIPEDILNEKNIKEAALKEDGKFDVTDLSGIHHIIPDEEALWKMADDLRNTLENRNTLKWQRAYQSLKRAEPPKYIIDWANGKELQESIKEAVNFEYPNYPAVSALKKLMRHNQYIDFYPFLSYFNNIKEKIGDKVWDLPCNFLNYNMDKEYTGKLIKILGEENPDQFVADDENVYYGIDFPDYPLEDYAKDMLEHIRKIITKESVMNENYDASKLILHKGPFQKNSIQNESIKEAKEVDPKEGRRFVLKCPAGFVAMDGNALVFKENPKESLHFIVGKENTGLVHLSEVEKILDTMGVYDVEKYYRKDKKKASDSSKKEGIAPVNVNVQTGDIASNNNVSNNKIGIKEDSDTQFTATVNIGGENTEQIKDTIPISATDLSAVNAEVSNLYDMKLKSIDEGQTVDITVFDNINKNNYHYNPETKVIEVIEDKVTESAGDIVQDDKTLTVDVTDDVSVEKEFDSQAAASVARSGLENGEIDGAVMLSEEDNDNIDEKLYAKPVPGPSDDFVEMPLNDATNNVTITLDDIDWDIDSIADLLLNQDKDLEWVEKINTLPDKLKVTITADELNSVEDIDTLKEILIKSANETSNVVINGATIKSVE